MDSDLTSGTGTVKIGGKEISQENSSKFSKISGDEAGSAPKKGIITSKNMGKAYAQKWSMDVKADGKGLARFSDVATTNHASNSGQPALVLVGKPGAPDYASQDCLVGSWDEIQKECNSRRDGSDRKKTRGGAPVSASSTDPADFQAFQAHHIVPDRCYRCGRVAGVDTRIPDAPSRGDGICICLPRLKHSAARPSTGADVTVHHHIDQALTDLGQQSGTRASPRGCSSMEHVRDQSLAGLKELVNDGTIDEDCFKKAARAVRKQAKSMAGRQVRAEKSLRNVSTTARGRLARAP
jgi:hypothetical protein